MEKVMSPKARVEWLMVKTRQYIINKTVGQCHPNLKWKSMYTKS